MSEMFLTSLIFFPFIGALILMICSKKQVKIISTVLSLFYFLWSLCLFFFFDPSHAGIQLSEKIELFPSLGIHYLLGIDGISFWMVLLTSFLFPLAIIGSVVSVQKHIQGFLSCLFLLTGFVMGSFLALDGILFYIFFEGSLLPLFFLILIWGGEQRVYASIKFFIYTALGSLFMLIGLLTLMVLNYNVHNEWSASLLDFYQLHIPFVSNYILSSQSLLFFCFFIAFAVKTPLFPFHTWLPLAHVQAPTAGSVFLAAVVLKMGAYGFLRFILPLFPEASAHYSTGVCFLAVLSIVYGAMMALAQNDFKKLIAYSSVSHMGYVVLGFFVFNFYSLSGGVLQMIVHGLSSAGLFFLVGMIYERTQTMNLKAYGGVAHTVPIYSALFFLISLSAIAFPFTGGFIAEFLILLGVFTADIKWMPFAVLGVVFGAVYMLFLIYRVFFGPVKMTFFKDLNWKERIVIIPIVILIFITGIFPNAILNYSQKSLEHLLKERFNYHLSISNSSQNGFSLK